MIQTYWCSIDKPVVFPQDSQGKEIFVGDYVIYNLSGSLEKGKINFIKKYEVKDDRLGVDDEIWRSLYCEIHVSNCTDGKISKMKNPNSIYKISESNLADVSVIKK